MFAKILNLFTNLFSFLKTIPRYRVMIPVEREQPTMSYLYELTTNKKIHDPEFRTLVAIHYWAARYQDYRLPPLQIATLAAIRKTSTRTIEFHLARLQRLGLLLVTPLGDLHRELVILGEKIFMPSVLVLKHVVVDSNNSNHELNNFNPIDKQQQLRQLVTHEQIFELQRELANILTSDGRSSPKALSFAKHLIDKYGYSVCFNQLAYLDCRIELFKRSPAGLKTNAAGVLIASIKNDWTPPPPPDKPDHNAWYTDDEFNQLIEH